MVGRLSMPKGHSPAAARSNDFFGQLFAAKPVMAIVRGLQPAETVELCERAWQAGIDAVEVPVERPSAFASLQAACITAKRLGRKIGVGTVTDVSQLSEAASLGAAFTVAPGLCLRVARASLAQGLPHLPGVATASEVQAALSVGLRWLKVFPAAQLGPSWVSAMLSPFPGVCFVVTGGVDAHNARQFISAGARAVGVASALKDLSQLGALSSLQVGASM
jgi:2-dehydro-3-deoxyphosphogluconate aldolase/(4S)-4-hydroxy-2-oxoglutarate aldolase